MAFSAISLLAVTALAAGLVDAQQCTGRAFNGPCFVGAPQLCVTPGDVCDMSVPQPQGPQCCTPAGGNTGGNGNCADTGANCAINTNLCKNPIYEKIMSDNCAATCGLCSGGAVASKPACVDSNPNCALWNARQFCMSSYYSDAQKRQYCERTCGYCTP